MALMQNPDTIAARLSPGEPTEEWFDRELRPVIVVLLDQVRRQAADDRAAMLSGVRHWLGELPQRSGAWSEETRQVVAALASELQGRIETAA